LHRKIVLLCFFINILSTWPSIAQEQNAAPQSKKIEVAVKGDRFLFLNDHACYVSKDTVIYVADTVDVLIKKNNFKKTKAFYEMVENKMSKSKVSSMIFDFLFVGSEKDNPHKESDSELRFSAFQGEKMKKVKHKNLPILGSRINDTTYYKPNKYSKVINNVHINTRDWIIKKNILFEEEEKIDSKKMVESERLLRRMAFIKDARIMVKDYPRSKKSDVVVVTKDVFPYNFQINPDNDNNSKFGVSHINIGGIGHQLEYDFVKSGEYELFYTVPNIGGTFIDGQIDYSNHFRKNGLGLNLDRDFVTQETRFGGGVEISQFEFGRFNYNFNNNELEGFFYTRRRQDFWIGRSFETNFRSKKLGFSKKTYAVVSGRVDYQDYFDKPIVRIDTNYVYHDRSTRLISVGLTSREYYKDKFILNFGRTEDIPRGTALSLVFGTEQREFENRYYIGATYARGGYVKGFGYFNSIYSLGSYTNHRGFRDGVLSIKWDYFSSLNQFFKQYKYRQFVSFSLAHAIKPTEDIQISGQNEIGIRGLSAYFLRSTSKINLKTESLVFTPITFIGFRMAAFAFFDVTTTFNTANSDFDPNVFYGLGGGLRFRNDNLAISTIQLTFGAYPNKPINATPSYIEISTSSSLGIRDFDFKAPEIVPFN